MPQVSHPLVSSKAAALLIAAVVLFCSSDLHAQVAVYKLILKADDTASVNLAYFERAYLAIDLKEGIGTLFFLGNPDGDSSDQGKYFVEAPDAMQAYTAFDSDENGFFVVRSFAKNRTAQSAYVATGRIDDSIDPGERRASPKIARTLTGVFTSTDDESDLSTAPTDGSLGVGGFGSLTATLEKERSKDANRKGLSYAETVSALRQSLIDQGFENLGENSSTAEPPPDADPRSEPDTGPVTEPSLPSRSSGE